MGPIEFTVRIWMFLIPCQDFSVDRKLSLRRRVRDCYSSKRAVAMWQEDWCVSKWSARICSWLAPGIDDSNCVA